MNNRSPIYSLFHQEIKACVERLLEICHNKSSSEENDAKHILDRLQDLSQFASKVRSNEHYLALYTLKHYLENTMLLYLDEQKKPQSMRLSEALSLLRASSQEEIQFQPVIVNSLTEHLIRHILEETQPGRPLFKNLNELKKL